MALAVQPIGVQRDNAPGVAAFS